MNLFDGVINQTDKIVKDIKVFDDTYIPKIIRFRDQEIGFLADIYKTYIKLGRAENILITGITGTGKTLLIKKVLTDLVNSVATKNKRIVVQYVNCRIDNTQRKIKAKFIRENTSITKIPEKTDEVNRIFETAIKDSDLVILILDEFDKYIGSMYRKDAENFIYLCSRIYTNVQLILVSADLIVGHYIDTIEASVRDTFRYKTLMLNDYTQEQLKAIITDRMVDGLVDGSWDTKIAQYIAEKSDKLGGGARTAMEITRRVINLARQMEIEKLTESMVDRVVSDIEGQSFVSIILSLRAQPLSILMKIFEAGIIDMETLQNRFEADVKGTDYNPSIKNFTKFVNILDESGLIVKKIEKDKVLLEVSPNLKNDVNRVFKIMNECRAR